VPEPKRNHGLIDSNRPVTIDELGLTLRPGAAGSSPLGANTAGVCQLRNQSAREALSYTCGTADIPLLGKCIGQVLDETAGAAPDQCALVVRHERRRLTYGELRDEVELLARGLLSLGIQKGDRVGIWSTNSSPWVMTQFATAKIGAILVSINPLNRAFELEHVLRQSECQTLLLIDGFRDARFPAIVRELCPELDRCDAGALTSAKLPHLQHLIYVGEQAPRGMMSWGELLQRGQATPARQLRAREAELEFDDSINIQYTSGTTGFPKGATLSHHNIVNNGLLIASALKLTTRDRLCIPVPFYHCFGMVLANMACVVTGATMVVPAPHFDPEATLRAVEEERCTALHGVPTMFIAQLTHPNFAKYDVRSLRTGIMSGSPCPIAIMRRVVSEMSCRELTIAYGLTEASPVITLTTTDDPIELRVTTVGRALPHTEIKIVDPVTRRMVPVGESGELCTRGYLVMRGYYKDPEATRAAIDAEGWLHTGDLGMVDERGYVKITGRAKDVIIRGGENIYPREVEEFLYSCPAITDVQIIGVPDLKFGEAVVAWVKLTPGSTLTIDGLRAFCAGKIADFKIPRYLKIVDAFPMTVTGKMQKFQMREVSIRELGLVETRAVVTA
jgi:fatty-acyl-CoA synthase